MLLLRQGFSDRQLCLGLYLPIVSQMPNFYPGPTQDSGDQEAAVAMGRVFLAAQKGRAADC
jgi:hypothetical protein